MEKNDPAKNTSQEILVEVCNKNKGVITLNRPRSLNALNLPMTTTILSTLKKWENEMDLVVVKSACDKAFCAGGDVFAMAAGGPSNPQYGIENTNNAYTIVYTINKYKIPYISLVDGIAMGGGVGLSHSGKYCIASEKSVFAMPETSIGFFPDVGTSYFFSRLGNLGLYLALTGHKLHGKDAVKIGYASHFVESKNLSALIDDILKNEGNDLENVIENYSEDISDHVLSLTPHLQLIDRVFSAQSVKEIMERLRSEGSEFSKVTLNQLNKMSPIALKTVKTQLEKASGMSMKECLQMDHRLAKAAFRAISSCDFYEGTTALKQKRVPKWNPEKLEDVSDEMVEKLFLPTEEELDL
ncbi:3-hydroxyisobutyryl-CoA hydrolase, mitochondrial-like [Macrosteles quadrilineatus]|uniref:3-hydroxyisobutyryl-CoA hydrolase, mitochondrial-like n=1 Tax=Macrosteles quadrilineatus TaxID=74068 RepID=UPI0023E0AEA5|nr:3-hydroxyisobutyryl-CoA hydrolase, mitochondrial-like [Macrosteles quadrilineatus]